MFNRFLHHMKREIKSFKRSHIKQYAIYSFGYLFVTYCVGIYIFFIITPFVYFVIKSIPSFSKEFYYHLRYLSIRNINQKLAIINVSKQDDEIRYKMLTYEPLERLEKIRSQLAIYFNTNILAIEQSSRSKRIAYLVTAKTVKKNSKNKTRTILNQLAIPNSNLAIKENDFIKCISFDCYDTKKVLSNKDNIAMLLGVETSKLSIKLSKNIIMEISKQNNKIYYLQDHIFSLDKPNKDYQFLLGINKATGELLHGNIKEYLHTLIFGASGSGKSCFFNVVLQSLMYFNDKIVFCLIDYKILEFKRYGQLKNTLYISDHNDTLMLFKALMGEMNRRFDIFSKHDVLDIYEYNEEVQYLPMIFVAIDEIADLRLTKSDVAEEIEETFKKLMNKGRASGIIFWVACQRPSHGQIDTDVRANLDSRIAFKVSDSKEASLANVPDAHNLTRANAIVKSQISTNQIKGLFIDKKHNNVFNELKSRAKNGQQGNVVNISKTPSTITHSNDLIVQQLKENVAFKREDQASTYIDFKRYIWDSTQSGDTIPKNQIYIDALGLTDKQVRTMKEKCLKEGIFTKNKARRYVRV